MSDELSGKVALVTGASKNIGKGIALEVGASGATTYLTARSVEDVPGQLASLQRTAAEIEACGGQFKGLELGLVDFPSEIDGQVGLLCWQYGEKEITHWHPLESGFDGRQPLPKAVRRPYLQ